MKRLVLYALILALVWIVPTEGVDVAKLRPIEVIAVYQQENTVVLATDTEDLGTGTDAAAALKDLRRTSPAVIYLDTADYLLISENAEGEVEALRSALKDSVKLCKISGKIDLKDAAKFLPVHGNLPSLEEWETGTQLPELTTENSRLKMSEKEENNT